MASQDHWDRVYSSKAADQLSWFQETPALSLELIERYGTRGCSVLDVGGGTSQLFRHLQHAGFRCTVLDISQKAIEVACKSAEFEEKLKTEWIVTDILSAPKLRRFDVWHDRAVFHFLIDPLARRNYANLAAQTVVSRGYLIIATFALDGPLQCSGLPAQRYDKAGLAEEFAPNFTVISSVTERHKTPTGSEQSFLYLVLERR